MILNALKLIINMQPIYVFAVGLFLTIIILIVVKFKFSYFGVSDNENCRIMSDSDRVLADSDGMASQNFSKFLKF